MIFETLFKFFKSCYILEHWYVVGLLKLKSALDVVVHVYNASTEDSLRPAWAPQ
jgi:hypothetical protein